GIPLVNAGELPKMDPYEEVSQQEQAYPLSPAYVPDPMELDEHVLVYVLEPEHPEYHLSTDDDIQPSDDDDDDDDTDDEDGEPIEDEEEEEHLALADPSTVPVVDLVPSDGDTKTVRLKPPMLASMEARIAEHVAAPIPPTNPANDQAPLGHREAMIRMRDDIPEDDMPPRRRFVLAAPPPGCDVAKSSAAAARPPRGQYDFVDTVVAGQGLIRSPSHDARTIARAADRVDDVGYVRALQTSEHRMMTSIEEVNLRVSYQAQVRRQESKDFYTQLHDTRTDRRDIRLEINVVRGQRIAYEAELRKVRQAYLSSEAQNRALLARLETLETDMTRMEWQRQRAEDD
ncbi:hypothetical protein Tco_1550769, partial [Tanacetum coccineum]